MISVEFGEVSEVVEWGVVWVEGVGSGGVRRRCEVMWEGGRWFEGG